MGLHKPSFQQRPFTHGSRDDTIDETLNIDVVRHWGNLIQPPGAVVSGTGAA